MQRRALLLGLSVVACGPKPIAAPPAAPRVTSAAETIPSDLDVVVRVDLASMRAALGAVGLSAAASGLLAHAKAYGGDADPASKVIAASFLEADTVYLGYRPSPTWAPLDRVLALQGHFAQLVQPPAGFSAATDLGGDVRYWDAKAKPARDGVARIYGFGERLRVFVSEAEIDAVERMLDGLSGPRRLEPMEEGTLSLAARPLVLGRLAGQGRLRELLQSALVLRAVMAFEGGGLRVKAELLLDGPESAQELADAGQMVLVRALGAAAPAAQLRVGGDRLLLSILITNQQLATLLGCFGLGSASAQACPW